MPKIFSDEKKQKLYVILKQNCIALIKEHGYKGFHIRDLARMTGLSAGTFYHFYPSKEDLIFEILHDCQDRLEMQFMEIHQLKGSVGRKEWIDLYNTFFITDPNNMLRYLSGDDLTSLFLRTDRKISFETVKNLIADNLKYLSSPKENINFNAVINFTQLINLCNENRDILVEEELTGTIQRLLENIADEIFEKET